jgi:hypothetical protein
MARLPNPGSDSGTWGDILNDFLLEEHGADGKHPAASFTTPGFVQLAGDLAGTAAEPTVPALASKETPAGAQAKVDAHNADLNAHLGRSFNKAAAIIDPVVSSIIIWRASTKCTVAAIHAVRTGGSGASVNVRKNNALFVLSSDLSLATAGNWLSGSNLQNATFDPGDSLEIVIAAVSGTPTQIGIQIDFITS